MSVPGSHVYTRVTCTRVTCLYQGHMSVPWSHVCTRVTCLYQGRMSVPGSHVCTRVTCLYFGHMSTMFACLYFGSHVCTLVHMSVLWSHVCTLVTCLYFGHMSVLWSHVYHVRMFGSHGCLISMIRGMSHMAPMGHIHIYTYVSVPWEDPTHKPPSVSYCRLWHLSRVLVGGGRLMVSGRFVMLISRICPH